MSAEFAAVLGFLVLLSFSALFSASETAFFSLSHVELEEMKPEGRVRRLLRNPDRLLVTILFGNTLVNTGAGALGALLALHLARTLGFNEGRSIALEVGAVTLVVLVFGEVTPKMFAMQKNRVLAPRLSRFLIAIMTAARPLVAGLSRLSATLGGRAAEGAKPFVTAEELRTIVALSGRRGTLEDAEREMIDSVMEFGETLVRETMVSRADIEGLEDTATVGEAITRVREIGFSRLPVYHGDIDHVTGILYAKDLLPFDPERDAGRSIADLPRKAFFTPESKKAGELLRELQRRRTHIAVVVNEYGGTVGLVTLEDLIEEIVGEIRDEYDSEEALVRSVDERTLVASGAVRLDELAAEHGVGIDVGERGLETLAGYLLDEFGRVPLKGESLELGRFRFEVAGVKDQRITSVRITREDEVADAEEDRDAD